MTTFEPINHPTEPSPLPNNPGGEASVSVDSFDLGAEPGAPEAAGIDGGGEGIASAGPAVLSRDDFFGGFRALFQIPNAVLAFQGVPALQSLAVADDDAQARAASDVLYDICAETPWLRFLLSPDSVWAQRLMVLGVFAAGRAQLVAAELAARKKPARQGAPSEPAAAARAPVVDGPKDGDRLQ